MFKCKKCENTEYYLKEKGTATGLYCAKCGFWHKWVGKDQLERYKIGMYQVKKQTQSDQIIDRINAELRLENDSCGLKQNALLDKVINIIKEVAK